jgi:diguanylate cyclase (GGDEF)-like protein
MQPKRTWQQRVQSLFSLERRNAIVLCAVLFAAIAVVDVVTPPALNLTFAYVFVILLACWNIGTAAGLIYAGLAFAMQLVVLSDVDLRALKPVYWYIILGNRLFTFLLVVGLTAPLRTLYRNQLATARLDSLTGAVNRRQLMENLASEIARSRRTRLPLSMAYLDCDDFKKVNDLRGHGEGDVLLRTAVEAMRQNLRTVDTVARVGGDEFILLLPDTDEREAASTLERVRSDLDRVMAANKWEVTFSTGLGTFDGIDLPSDDMVARCDALMYRAKGERKGCMVREVFRTA